MEPTLRVPSLDDPTENAISEYLSLNPGFVRDWFIQNVDKDTMEGWLLEADEIQRQQAARRIESRTSITTAMFHNLVSGKTRKTTVPQRISREELLAMNERDVFMELIRDIANELDVDILCHKILLNVSILTKSDRGSLFLVRGSNNNKYLVSKLFDVSENSSLQECLHTEDNHIRVPFGTGIAGTVAETKETIRIEDAYSDSRFNKEVDRQTGYQTRSILCMPILNYQDQVIGVAQIMNKNGGEVFSDEDEGVFKNYLTFCGIGLTNAQLFEMSVQEYQRNQLMLSLARGIFEEQTNLDNLVQKIMIEAQGLLHCQRCSVYLVDNKLQESRNLIRRLDSCRKDFGEKPPSVLKDMARNKNLWSVYPNIRAITESQSSSPEDVDFSKAFEVNHGTKEIVSPSIDQLKKSRSVQIARDVAISGQPLNTSDTLTDPDFSEEITDYDGFKVNSLLSVPIKNSDTQVVGVVQLMNKCNGRPYSKSDVNTVEAFAIFCGLGIHNCQMYEEACKLMAKQTVALEVLSYHASAPTEETDKLQNAEIPAAEDIKLKSFDFCDFSLTDDQTCQATLRMFMELDIINQFHVPYDVACRWILSVKKNYRPVTYHNWRHAFNVAQTMFSMLYTGKMAKYMDSLEMWSCLVACLCHDLDHRGTNNSFQSKSSSPLATLYGTSTMEHHHFDQCIMILNSEGNNIFMHLSPADYRKAIAVVESAILSTDLALYFKKKNTFESLVKTGETNWEKEEHKDLLRGMMMTACDVAAITKPWEVQKEIAQLVASEFFEQGDLERDKLGQQPIAMMDRKKKDDLPKMQVDFIDCVCTPVYKMMRDIQPELHEMYDGCMSNRTNWLNMATEKEDDSPTPDRKSSQEVMVTKRDLQPTMVTNGNQAIIDDATVHQTNLDDPSALDRIDDSKPPSPSKRKRQSSLCALL